VVDIAQSDMKGFKVSMSCILNRPVFQYVAVLLRCFELFISASNMHWNLPFIIVCTTVFFVNYLTYFWFGPQFLRRLLQLL